MSKKIEDLQEDVRDAARAALTDMDINGIKYSVQNTFRTTDEQIALYAQGRKALVEVQSLRKIANMPPLYPDDNAYTVTNCDGTKTKSAHQSGRAIDIVPIDSRGNPYWPVDGDSHWVGIANIMKAHGFIWGGDWKDFPDAPHYQM